MAEDPKAIRIVSSTQSTSGSWSPIQGPIFTNLLNSNAELSDGEKDRLVQETVSIMSECVVPKAVGTVNTGLVIGFVQSGKTLSFTSLVAMARDNCYRLVVLLAGTTNNLVEQSFDRLKVDLNTAGTRKWNLFTTQQGAFQKSQAERINTELERWRRGSLHARTVLIVSMKQHQHLDNLAKLLRYSNFCDVPTLIIDDEGDQAGINTKAKKEEESTTYTKIKSLRNLFPHHSYILYTATPQAPLLISRIDALSPDFGRVLTPGEHYVGGQDFFVEGANKFVKLVPMHEVPDKYDPPREPPKSLLAALRDFFIGVAIGWLEDEFQKGGNRSMMIHPAVTKDEHLMFARWTRQIKDNWANILDDVTHPEHSVLREQFQVSAEGMLATYNTSLTYKDIAPKLSEAIDGTTVEELNTRERSRIASVNWEGEYSWILIGGVGLDRGFTVEGLTVSYMTRSTGVGNADNIQQRARFFGYKKHYLGLCRIYLTNENINAFTNYVKHEESVRSSIRDCLGEGKTLKEWRRTYFLDQSLKPTRSSVILLEMYQSKRHSDWVVPDHPFDGSETVSDNREVAERILDAFHFKSYAEEGWNDRQVLPAFSDRILLADIMPMIGQFRYRSPDDNLQHSALMLRLMRLADEEPALTCIFRAFSGPWSGVDSNRTLTEKAPYKIRKLFQGSNANTNYPGARALISKSTITFQLHRYDIRLAKSTRVINDVPILAVHIPKDLSRRVWVER